MMSLEHCHIATLVDSILLSENNEVSDKSLHADDNE
jgi:hypothetical protein